MRGAPKHEQLLTTFAEAHGLPAHSVYELTDDIESLIRWHVGRARNSAYRQGVRHGAAGVARPDRRTKVTPIWSKSA